MYKSQFSLLISTSFLMTLISIAPKQSLAADTDPTRPFGVNGSGSSQLKRDSAFVLTSIIHGDGIHTAVINGNIYKIYDYVGEYRITAINSHSVIMRSKTKRLKINIFKHTGFKSNVVENTVAN